MLPTLQPGARVQVQPVPETGLRPGDVVAVRYRDHLVLHRVHVLSEGWVTTAGDNQDFFDPAMPIHDVVGVVRGLSPNPAPYRWPTSGTAATTAVTATAGAATPAAATPAAATLAAGDGAPVTVWLITNSPCAESPPDLPGGWQIKRRPAYGVGVETDVLLELQAELAHRLCVVVTERAVRTVGEVIDRPLPPGTQVVIGCSLGRLDGDLPGHLLPPELTDIRVRCGPPLQRSHPLTALHALTRAVRGLPAAALGRPGGRSAG